MNVHWIAPLSFAMIASCGEVAPSSSTSSDASPSVDTPAPSDDAGTNIPWAKQLGASSMIADIATNAQGDVIVVGNVVTTPIETTDPALPCSAGNGFVATYDGDTGAQKWLLCNANFFPSCVAVAPDGSIAAVGTASGIAVLRVSADGSASALFDSGRGLATEPIGIAVDRHGTAYVGAALRDEAVDVTNLELALFAIDERGSQVWWRTLATDQIGKGSNANSFAAGDVSVTTEDELTFAGWYNIGPTEIDPGVVLPSRGNFVAGFDLSGNARWATLVGDRPGYASPFAARDLLAFTGLCGPNTVFGSSIQTCPGCGLYWGCLAVYGDRGQPAWFAPMTEAGWSGIGTDVAFDNAGHVYAASVEIDSAIGGQGGPAYVGIQGFDVATGARTFGPMRPSSQSFGDSNVNTDPRNEPLIAIQPSGAIIVAGPFTGTATFGAHVLTSQNGDAYLLKVVP